MALVPTSGGPHDSGPRIQPRARPVRLDTCLCGSGDSPPTARAGGGVGKGSLEPQWTVDRSGTGVAEAVDKWPRQRPIESPRSSCPIRARCRDVWSGRSTTAPDLTAAFLIRLPPAARRG